MHLLQIRAPILTVCATMVLAVCIASPRAAPPQASQGPHAVAPDLSHDFGDIEQGRKVVHQFIVRNAGTASLTLTRVSLSRPGMNARMKPSILPGEQATLTVEWNTAGVTGAVEGKAVLEVNDPASPRMTFVVTGVVKQPIEFLPGQGVYASVYKGESARRTVRVVNNRERPLGISRLEQQGDHFRAAIRPVESGKAYELEVTVPTTVPPGRYTEAVFLYTDDPKMPRLMVPVNVLVKADVYANPEVVDFGRISSTALANSSVVDLLTQSFMVRKRAGTFSIKAATSDVPFVTIRRSPEGATTSEAFRIDVALMKDRLQPGPIAGTIRIVTDDKRFPEIIVPVRGEVQ